MNPPKDPVTAETRELVNRRWRTIALPSALVLVALVISMYDTFSSLVALWGHSANYGHGLLVLAVSCYLIYLRREDIATEKLQISVIGLLGTIALITVWFASRVLSVLIGEQVTFVFVLIFLTMALYGTRITKIVALPILYLFCAVPVWSYLIPVFQSAAAEVSTRLGRALGVPIYLEGIHMTIPNGVFLVAEVCAGISYLLAALSLGGFYALLNLRSNWTRVVLVLLAIVAGVVFNWIRVTIIVLAGHYGNMQHFLVREHVMFGWFLFVLVVLFLMVCGRVLERFDTRGAEKEAVVRKPVGPHTGMLTTWVMAIACTLVLVVPTYALTQLAAPSQDAAGISLSKELGEVAGWRVDAFEPADGWSASFHGPDSQAGASFVKKQQRIDLQVGYFTVQRQGSEAANDRHSFYDYKVWRRISQKAVADQVSIAPGLVVNEVSLQQKDDSGTRLVWWWYWVNQEFTANAVQAKLLQVSSILSGNRAAAVVVMSSKVMGNQQQTRDEMSAWLRESAAGLAANLKKPPG